MIRSFETYASAVPDRVAIVAADGTEYSFGTVFRRAGAISRLIERSGVKRGEVVGTLLPNTPDMLIVQRGTLQMPVYLSAINWHLTAPEVAYILDDAGVRLLFTVRAFEETARAALDLAGLSHDRLVVIDADPSEAHSLAARAEGLEPLGRPEGVTAGTKRLYTSGTTGRPKAVLRPLPTVPARDAAAPNIERAGVYGVDHEAGRYLSVAPLYHAAPLGYADQALDLGHTVVMMTKWDARVAVDTLRDRRITWTYLVPLMFREMLALPAEERTGVDSLLTIIHTAAPCPPHVKRAMIEWVGPILTEIYGGTEGSATVIRSDEWLEHPGSVGRARPGARVEIRDDDDRLVAPNTVGRIFFANPSLAFVYDNDAEKTASSRVGDAVTLGDIGYLDDDDYLFLMDRAADLVISGGVNIYPAEIENALKETPGVVDACVIGVPDEHWGEALHAVVVLAQPPTDAQARSRELMASLRERIAGYKVPRTFDFVAELPYSEAGKLLRRVVREHTTA